MFRSSAKAHHLACGIVSDKRIFQHLIIGVGIILRHRNHFATMRTTRIIIIALALSSQLLAQEAQPPKPCIGAEETVYKPGIDGVTPPQPLPDKSKSAMDIRGPMSLELVVNSEGHVCSAKVVSAKDQLSAKKVADHIAEHWTFKPATRQGKPVAVSFTTNFGPR